MILPELIEYQRIIYRNFVSVFSKVADTVMDESGYRAIVSDCRYPLFNGVLCTQQEEDIDTLIQDVKMRYAAKNLPWCWWHTSLTKPEDLPQHLKEAGFTAGDSFAGMIKDLDCLDESVPLNESVIIEHLESVDELEDWIVPIAQSFEFAPEVAAFYSQMWRNHFQDKNIIHIKASIKGKLVGTGTLCLETDACGFYNLSVLPEYRNQKIATTIQMYRLRLAKELGFKYAVLQASKMAEHLDARAGFKRVMRFTPYYLA